MFTVFVEAGKALEELPRVRADLEAAQDLLSEANATLTHRDATIAALQSILEGAQAQTKSLEAELAQATFRERAAKEAVNAIRSLLVIADVPVAGSAVEVAAPAARIDTPTPEPMPLERNTPTEVPTPSVTVDGSIPEVADTSNSGTQGASNGSGGQSEVGPTPSDASLTEALPAKTVSSSDTAPSTEGQCEANPTQNVVQSTEGRSTDAISLDAPAKASVDSPSNFYLYPTPADDFNYAV
jgi:hypothetical protein